MLSVRATPPGHWRGGPAGRERRGEGAGEEQEEAGAGKRWETGKGHVEGLELCMPVHPRMRLGRWEEAGREGKRLIDLGRSNTKFKGARDRGWATTTWESR